MSPEKLTAGEQKILRSAELIYISAASLWEIGILIAGRRIPRDEQMFQVPEGLELLPILPDHCREFATLPQHHGDPFDRMLVAQAQSERVPLLTRDRVIAAYGDQATILRYPDA